MNGAKIDFRKCFQMDHELKADGIDIKLEQHPSKSLELNVLALIFFYSLRKKAPMIKDGRDFHDMIASMKITFQEYPLAILGRI